MAVTWIALHLTDRCQLDCQHCLRDPGQKPKDLSLDTIRKVLAEARRRYHTRQVALTGGEPTLHPEFEGVLDAIVEHDCTWHIVTNGRRFEQLLSLVRDDPARRERLTAVNLSLDGADEATHDAIRGAGSFRDVMKAVTLCTAHGIPFVLQMVLHARNVHQIEAFGLMAAQLGAARASLSMLQATGTHHDEALYLPPRAWQDAQHRIERLAAALTMPVTMPEGFYREQAFHVCEAMKSEALHVDVEGRLNLCCQHAGVPSAGPPRDVAGDLATTSLLEAHGRLLGIIHEAQAARLAAMAEGSLDAWDHFPCNWCMKHFDKPHWTNAGTGGPPAQRERWRGAWAKKVTLPVVR
ncbi:radical SAM protein [Polyangium jinanense]|uniref:Radical SAM protein n=1 Tax=Polyangium jinanense TaxID=2829994 RepID=A0A9X3XBS7_9BACT|nr:radical SAM protein [Polyangium jinanense]MDC3957518.1 radical SAM protein [Polyangium jinanense]MDC3984991.1 radical SAM protein [Polyangium jinanense]